MKIVFFGTRDRGIRELLKNNKNVVAIFATPQPSSQTKLSNALGTIKDIGKEYDIPVYIQKVNSDESVELLKNIGPDVIFSCGFRQIIKQPVIDVAKIGIINLHPSLLPDYKGVHAITWAIINGENKIGITAHFIDVGIDTGDIILQKSMNVKKNDTYNEVTKEIFQKLEPELIMDVINMVENDNISRIKQEHQTGSYWPKRSPADGIIDWNNDSEHIYNMVRALVPPLPGAFSFFDKKKIVFVESEDSNDVIGDVGKLLAINPVKIGCGKGHLIVNKILVNDKEYDASKYFKAIEVGLKFESEKEIIRKDMLKKRRLLDNQINLSQDVIGKLNSLPEFQNAKTVSCYLSSDNEVYTHELIKKLIKSGKMVAAPKIIRNEMKMIEIGDFRELTMGVFDTLEPNGNEEIQEFDIILIPGIAFDKNRNRIGYGKGYYDDFLKKSKALKIALSYDFQVIDNINSNFYDIKMDFVVTDKRVI